MSTKTLYTDEQNPLTETFRLFASDTRIDIKTGSGVETYVPIRVCACGAGAFIFVRESFDNSLSTDRILRTKSGNHVVTIQEIFDYIASFHFDYWKVKRIYKIESKK